MVQAGEDVMLEVAGQSAPLRVPRRDLCQLIRERAHELARLVMIKLREAGVGDVSNFTVVLTGGTSNLPGLQQLMQRTLGMRVRLGVPDRPQGIPSDLRSPAHATGVGIMMWASKQQAYALAQESNEKKKEVDLNGAGVIARFFRQVRAILAV